ncbi:MAG TPA: peptidoglycan-associated lipoprotein Pal [Gallionellaceae bacterium]|nr:peptidoglycan-associated lipoprotein Pal [Gallionellaceae bacterium]
MRNIATVITLTLLLGACATSQKTASTDNASSNAPAQAQNNAASQAAVDAQQLAAQLDALQKQSVYFDFDKSTVKPDYREVARHEAEWMRAHGNDTVTVAGNTDERGSPEYNLALGSRRAKAVHEALVALGVPSAHIKDVSYGEQKPRAACNEEKCWQENRRVDFVHKLN